MSEKFPDSLKANRDYIFILYLQLKTVANRRRKKYNIINKGVQMGQKEKLIEQLKSRPKTFTFHDAEVLLDYLEFTKSNKGKTSGSRVMFISEEHGSILLHKPHPQKELKAYQVRQLCDLLEQEGLI